jgi:hypothetical protein
VQEQSHNQADVIGGVGRGALNRDPASFRCEAAVQAATFPIAKIADSVRIQRRSFSRSFGEYEQ